MRIAIIDMGTNTFNLLIVETNEKSQFKVIYKDSVGVKLGKDGINNKYITPDAIQRGIDAIEKHINSIKTFKVDKIVTTATEGVRSSKNGKEFVTSIQTKFGINIQVITGIEEAELIYKGVKQAVTLNMQNVLILDIGGGSNEFIIANSSEILWKQSFKLGIARILDMFQPSDPITSDEINNVEEYFDSELSELYMAFQKFKPNKLVGCSGTFDSFRSMILAKNDGITSKHKNCNSFQIDLDDYSILHKDLINSTLEERKNMEGLDLIRVEMIVLASIFVNFIIKKLNLKSLTHSTFAIKEGVIDEILNS